MPRPWIVVVEDDWFIGDMLSQLLTWEGYDVTVCQTAAAVLPLVAHHLPALVVIDWHVETADGGAVLLGALRSQVDTAQLPIVLWSADPDVQRMHQRQEKAPLVVLEKPSLPEPFLANVRRLLAPTAT